MFVKVLILINLINLIKYYGSITSFGVCGRSSFISSSCFFSNQLQTKTIFNQSNGLDYYSFDYFNNYLFI